MNLRSVVNFHWAIHYVRDACLGWAGVNQTELFNRLERQHCCAARIIFELSTDMPTVDVLATVKWNTLTHLYQCFLIKLCYKGYHGMLPRILAEQIFFNRSSSRLKHGLIAPGFAFKYVQNSMGLSRLWNAIGWSNESILECTDVKSFLKNVKDFNFNVLAPQILNNRSENFICF